MAIYSKWQVWNAKKPAQLTKFTIFVHCSNRLAQTSGPLHSWLECHQMLNNFQSSFIARVSSKHVTLQTTIISLPNDNTNNFTVSA